MGTPRGVKLALLAARGELNHTCPPEFIHLLNEIKMQGIDTEIAKDFYLMMADYAVSNKNDDMFNKYREAYLTLFDPTYKNERDRIMKDAQEKFNKLPEDIKVRTKKGSAIKGEYKLEK